MATKAKFSLELPCSARKAAMGLRNKQTAATTTHTHTQRERVRPHLDDVLRGDELAAVQLLRVLQDSLCARGEVLDGQRILVAHPVGDLVQQDGVHHRVLDVGGKVGDAALAASALQVVVHPADEQLLGGQLEQVCHLLALAQQPNQLGVRLQVDVGHQTHLEGKSERERE